MDYIVVYKHTFTLPIQSLGMDLGKADAYELLPDDSRVAGWWVFSFADQRTDVHTRTHVRYKTVGNLRAAHGSSDMIFEGDAVFDGYTLGTVRPKKKRSMTALANQSVTHTHAN